MNDLVLKGFIDSFAAFRGLDNLPDDELFEAFVASCMLRQRHQSDITGAEDDVLLGGSGDGGIDALAILVNSRLVSTEEDLQFFFDSHGRLEVEFVFFQAKSSTSFSSSDIGTFLFGVEQFFNHALLSSSNLHFRAETVQKIDLARSIYSQSIKMQQQPKCTLYFATTGKWTGSTDPQGRITDGQKRLSDRNIFSEVLVTPIDAELLKSSYRELEREVVKEVEFIRTTSFPKIDRVGEAYIGLLPGDEFIKLVSTDDGTLNRELFFDNVRDFQGHNPVNREIEHTLADEQLRASFPLFNNGITIIARSIKRTADTFQIHDFQIVNGCQTTHILFRNRHVVGKDTFIPVKLVATDDSQVVNEVIKATNRQTAVQLEALESLSTFHRELEDLYNSRESIRSSSERIFYERRSKQYAMDNIRPTNIVTLTGQIKAFIGMFLDEPHSHPRYYGELLKAYEGRIFAEDHKPEPYYSSGVAMLLVEKWLNSHSELRDLRPYKHQLLMLLRMLISGFDIPRFNSNRISSYSLGIVDALRDPILGPQKYDTAADMLRSSLLRFRSSDVERPSGMERNPPHRLRAFTEQLKQDFYKGNGAGTGASVPTNLLPGTEERGKFRFFDDVKKYGFIGSNQGQDVFVHESEIGLVPYHLRVEGIDVIYTVTENPRAPGMLMATNVKLVPKEALGPK